MWAGQRTRWQQSHSKIFELYRTTRTGRPEFACGHNEARDPRVADAPDTGFYGGQTVFLRNFRHLCGHAGKKYPLQDRCLCAEFPARSRNMDLDPGGQGLMSWRTPSGTYMRRAGTLSQVGFQPDCRTEARPTAGDAPCRAHHKKTPPVARRGWCSRNVRGRGRHSYLLIRGSCNHAHRCGRPPNRS